MMYEKHGWTFPDYDTHFAEMLDKNIAKGGQPVYQEPVRRKSFSFVEHKGLALDIGANVGLWCRDMAKEFQRVIAFEPVADFRQCLQQNVNMEKVDLRALALGSSEGMIDMIITEENTGHSHVDPNSIGQGSIPMVTLDGLQLRKFDYVKIDCEGYEYEILLGAENSMKEYRPITVIEQKFHQDVGHENGSEAYDLLRSWGAVELARVRNDVIMGW